jgi:undecaprenyl-diphosphatase
MLFLIPLILFGILQGLTEFLPVSSSGHLSIFQYFSKDFDENLTLNIAVHLGTLLTVLIFYRKDILEILRGLLKKEPQSIKMFLLILTASIPTGIIGIIMKKKMDWILTNPLVAALGLLTTGAILFFSDKIKVRNESTNCFGLSYKDALIIGVVQGFAVLPGVSRSGSTIITGLALGMTPHNAARFSFLLSLPAILGAGLLEYLNLDDSVQLSPLFIGLLVSFVTGLLAISWMVKLTERGRLKYFSYYVIPLSVIFMLLFYFDIGKDSL